MTAGLERRILVVTPQLPEPPFSGFAIRVRELVRALSRRHSVTLLSYVWPWEEGSVDAFRDICESVQGVTPSWPEGADRVAQLRSLASRQPHLIRQLASRQMQAALDDLLARQHFDLVQVESSQLAGLDLSRAPATVLDEHNIEYELLGRSTRIEGSLARKAFGAIEYRKLRRAEQRAWQTFDGCIVTSEREVGEVRRFARGRPVAVVPNGVDVDFFAPHEGHEGSGLVFTGLMRYRPNIDAMTYFVREILPLVHRSLPDVMLSIVGWGLTDEVRALRGPKVVATDRVPDVRPYLSSAAAVVAPIRMGAGTRLKILEALAAARPVVSTSLGCEGLGLVDGQHLLMADDARSFADSILRVLTNPVLGSQLGRQGRRLVESRYAWNVCVEPLEELHERVVFARKHGSIGYEPPRAAAIVG